jgi:transposase
MNIRLPIREEIHAVFEQDEEAVMALFMDMEVPVEEVARQWEKQAITFKEWQVRLEKNSRNSRKPPLSNDYGKSKRTVSLRASSEKPKGGQPGHEVHNLKPSEQRDHQEEHAVETCQPCGSFLQTLEASGYEELEVFDILATCIEVTMHQAEIKSGPAPGVRNRGVFPARVTGPVPSGDGVKTWAAYFQSQLFVPVEQVTPIFEDLLNRCGEPACEYGFSVPAQHE